MKSALSCSLRAILCVAILSGVCVPPAAAAQARGSGFTVSITITSAKQLRQLAVTSQMAASIRRDSRGLPIYSERTKRLLRRTTAPPTVSFGYQ